MTRKKVKLAFIVNDSARKATFKKRKKGFLKKLYELTTLCEIEACAVIYSSYDAQPEVWPNQIGAQRVLSKFRRMPQMEKSKKMVNQEAFLRQRISKAVEQLKKQQKENREKEITQIMHDCLGGKVSVQNINLVELNDLGWLIDQNLKEINKREETTTTTKACKARGCHGGGFDHVNKLEYQDPTPIYGSWFMELICPKDPLFGGDFGQGNGGGDNMSMTFADYSNYNLTSFKSNNPFFP
ncbi:uncharacterized protein [Phyllobates terribilis]|uniref:uncharacterized protein n=1 Tax=Phyllobates terribilis TaxID=111132 RepID=UPI003CCB268E